MNDENYENYLTVTSEGLDINAHNIEAECITSSNNKFSLDCDGNLTVNSINFNSSENNLLSFEAIFNKIYPVGSIYMSNQNINPGTLFTGVWEQICGRFLIGTGPNEENNFNGFGTYAKGTYNFTPNEFGGEPAHQLTWYEMPEHSHNYARNRIIDAEPVSEEGTSRGSTSLVNNMKTYASTFISGANQYHNNLPPYYVVYMWKRVS